jgi:hypothetical protein
MSIDIIRYTVNRGNLEFYKQPTGHSSTSARGRQHAETHRTMGSVSDDVRLTLLICACAKYKDKQYRKKSGILKADFIDLLINYS